MNEPWLAVQPYYKVVRRVEATEQIVQEEDRELLMSPQCIESQNRTFNMKDVFDISYRNLGASGGMLYLHTRFGVYSYLVREDPSPFIKEFKELPTASE
ncbi:hypothetical protein JJQ72_09960 [Paenibacillus sp. F411]|uniref:hypothetical protein n=1 Tax=unclassified Paenibacillus TaxID=185978 RepID=UPI001AAE23AE|nr:hypothetical protein [Paenibacillus sp. F411]MBO2944291.1 hypothetical protein [Paenibacillus sp. F411]